MVILLDGVSYAEGTPISEAGVHLLSVSVSDEAGHTTTSEVLFTIDPDAPSITVEGVEDGATYAGTVLPVISTDDDATLDVLLNGAPWDGEALIVTANDRAANEAVTTLSFTN